MERRFDLDWRAVFHGRLEFPLRDRLAGESVEAVVDAAQNAHVADSAIGVDDGVQNYRATDVFVHEFERVSWIDFSRGGGLREFCGRGARVVIV